MLAALMGSVLATAAPSHATAPRIDPESCKEMRVEQAKFVETGILADLARGPEWAKANLAPEKLRQIELFILLDENLKFGCRDAKISPDAARAGQAAIELETPPATPPTEPSATPGAATGDAADTSPKAPSSEAPPPKSTATDKLKRQKPKADKQAPNDFEFSLFP